MKKIIMMAAAALLLLQSCGSLGNLGMLGGNQTGTTTTNTGGNVLGNLGGNALGGLLDLIVGGVKFSQQDIVGSWYYVEPACAFTSENVLAKAGGAVAAKTVNGKLQSVYNSLKISNSNTQLTFDQSGNFSGKIAGIPLSGTYTFDSSNGQIVMKATLITLNAFITRSTSGMNFTFESKKILSLLQTVSAFSGNSTLSTIGDISKSFDGVRVGFAMRK